ncbi:hypothetical protein NNO_1418 [Hydrogenimonas sp.]|nr:hypothetical protein NNO_1418 [Hydrogenimonas sp.]
MLFKTSEDGIVLYEMLYLQMGEMAVKIAELFYLSLSFGSFVGLL